MSFQTISSPNCKIYESLLTCTFFFLLCLGAYNNFLYLKKNSFFSELPDFISVTGQFTNISGYIITRKCICIVRAKFTIYTYYAASYIMLSANQILGWTTMVMYSLKKHTDIIYYKRRESKSILTMRLYSTLFFYFTLLSVCPILN